MTQINLQLETLTPLWTGGADRTVDRLHETGLLGSMRWWYEALVRGVGGHVCDGGTCKYNSDKPNNGLCDVCCVFGATGWRRRFRLTVTDNTQSTSNFPSRIKLHQREYTKKNGKTHTPVWYFEQKSEEQSSRPIPNPPRSGQFDVVIQSLDPSFDPAIIAGLIQFLADWAAIGARPQMGFGVVQVQGDRVDMQPLCNHLFSLIGTKTDPNLPSLATMFFTQIRVDSDRREKTFNLKYDLRAPRLQTGDQLLCCEKTFNLKYDLRALFRSNQKVRHFVMGTVQCQRMAAKVKMSHPYTLDDQPVMRVWGWIPDGDYGMTREGVLQGIHGYIQSYCIVWREFDSPRDTTTPNQTDMPAFLRSLMQIEEPQP